MIRRWVYRSRQFFNALLGSVTAEEMAEARQVLGPKPYRLFAQLPQQYRRHGLTVYRRVAETGCEDAVVQQAALLHDVGKFEPRNGRYVTIVHRVIVVLLEALPGGERGLLWLAEMGRRQRRREGDFRFYPFYLSYYHASFGAFLAERYGASDDVCALIANHHKHTGQSNRLLALQAADDRS